MAKHLGDVLDARLRGTRQGPRARWKRKGDEQRGWRSKEAMDVATMQQHEKAMPARQHGGTDFAVLPPPYPSEN